MLNNNLNNKLKYWRYGLSNAKIFVRECKYSDNRCVYTILINCDEFIGKLNITDNFAKNLSKTDKIHARWVYSSLKLSKWSFDIVYSLALEYILRTDICKKECSVVIRQSITSLVPAFTNDITSSLTLEVFSKSELIEKHGVGILAGIMDHFSNRVFLTLIGRFKDTSLLNNPNLAKLLHLCGVETDSLNQIILLCNFLKNFNPLVLFLGKIITHKNNFLFINYKYIYLLTFLESCTYVQLENFFISQSSDVELFYVELNINEKRRITNKVLMSSNKKINTTILVIKPLITQIIYPILFIWVSITVVNAIKKNHHYYANSQAASAPFVTIGLRRDFNPPLCPEFAAETSFVGEHKHLLSKMKSSTILSKLMPCTSTRTIETAVEISQDSEVSVSSNNENSTIIPGIPNTIKENLSIERPRRSTDSTEVNETSLFTKSSKRIIAGKLVKKKNIVARAGLSDPIDSLLDDELEEYVSRSAAFGKRIMRKKLSLSTLQKLKWSNGDVYLYFYPNHLGIYNRITFAGNDGVCAEYKSLNSDFKKEYLNGSKTKYKYMPFTFEHVLPHAWLNTFGVSNTPRSGAGDTLRGPLICHNTNVHMSKTNAKLDTIFKNTESNIFTENADLFKMMFNFSENHVRDGLDRLSKKWQSELTETRTTILHEDNIQNKDKSSFNSLTESQKYSRAVPGLIKYIEQKIDENPERGSIFQQEGLIAVLKQGYQNSLPYSITPVVNWCKMHGITLKEGAGYFLVCQIAEKSVSLVKTNYFLKDYSTHGRHACPAEVSQVFMDTLTMQNKAIMQSTDHLKANSPDNQAFHELLDAKVSNQKFLSKLFINKVKLNHQDVYEAFQRNQFSIIDKSGVAISAYNDQAQMEFYFQEWQQNIQKFENTINNMEEFKSPSFTPASAVIFDDLNIGSPSARDLLKPIKPTKYIEPFSSFAKGCTLADLEQARNPNSAEIPADQLGNPGNNVGINANQPSDPGNYVQ